MQEVWLAVSSGAVPLPKDIREARLVLFKVTRVVAQRLRRQRAKEVYTERESELEALVHQHASSDDDDVQERAALALGVFEAIEQLPPEQNRLAREYYVYGYTIKQIAERAGIPEDNMEGRVWRMSAELEKRRLKAEKRENARNKKRRSGMLIAPCALSLDPETRAAFCAIWEAEGRLEFGDSPPPSSTMTPSFPVAPIISSATGSFVAAVGVALLLVVLVLVPVSLVALHYFWKPPHSETAQTGLRVPPPPTVGTIEDVVPLYPTDLPEVPRAPAAVLPRPRVSPMPLSKELQDAPSGPPSERLMDD